MGGEKAGRGEGGEVTGAGFPGRRSVFAAASWEDTVSGTTAAGRGLMLGNFYMVLGGDGEGGGWASCVSWMFLRSLKDNDRFVWTGKIGTRPASSLVQPMAISSSLSKPMPPLSPPSTQDLFSLATRHVPEHPLPGRRFRTPSLALGAPYLLVGTWDSGDGRCWPNERGGWCGHALGSLLVLLLRQ